MIYLVQRINANAHGWTRPSAGRLWTGEGEFVRENGFGFEDWNFNLDLAVREHVYGYAYYVPSAARFGDSFRFAFVTYSCRRWHLVGFYIDAEFTSSGAPNSRPGLIARANHLNDLKSANSLGRQWAKLDSAKMILKLGDETKWMKWKVHMKNVVSFPQPIAIPSRIFNSSNHRFTRPTLVNEATFEKLRSLAMRTAVSDDDETAFPEGREVLLKHRARERNPALVAEAKAKFQLHHGRVFCQACGFDFERFYGEVGRGYIEAHHTKPVSELGPRSKTYIAELALVCSNCHRMLHRRRPWLTLEDLKSLANHTKKASDPPRKLG